MKHISSSLKALRGKPKNTFYISIIDVWHRFHFFNYWDWLLIDKHWHVYDMNPIQHLIRGIFALCVAFSYRESTQYECLFNLQHEKHPKMIEHILRLWFYHTLYSILLYTKKKKKRTFRPFQNKNLFLIILFLKI